MRRRKERGTPRVRLVVVVLHLVAVADVVAAKTRGTNAREVASERRMNQKSADADAEGPTRRADGLGLASAADALASGLAGKALQATTSSGA